jgi:hypothetical protein
MPDERVLPVEEAARHLELTGRVLHYRLQQGEFADAVRNLPGGRVGLAFRPPAKRWSLVVERPDPRIVALMKQARVAAGQTYRPWYTRRVDGECWQERW